MKFKTKFNYGDIVIDNTVFHKIGIVEGIKVISYRHTADKSKLSIGITYYLQNIDRTEEWYMVEPRLKKVNKKDI